MVRGPVTNGRGFVQYSALMWLFGVPNHILLEPFETEEIISWIDTVDVLCNVYNLTVMQKSLFWRHRTETTINLGNFVSCREMICSQIWRKFLGFIVNFVNSTYLDSVELAGTTGIMFWLKLNEGLHRLWFWSPIVDAVVYRPMEFCM